MRARGNSGSVKKLRRWGVDTHELMKGILHKPTAQSVVLVYYESQPSMPQIEGPRIWKHVTTVNSAVALYIPAHEANNCAKTCIS